MPATGIHPDDQPIFDPDELKMPESPQHRQLADLLAQAALGLLGTAYEVFADMNWYPLDGGNAVAPDVMVLPAGILPPGAKSYRQREVDGPTPQAVVEIPSDSDTYSGLRGKLRRYAELGTVVYVVEPEDRPAAVLRHDPDGEIAVWGQRPIPELGGFVIDTTGDELAVVTPEGNRYPVGTRWMAVIDERAQLADERARAAEERANALAEQLRAAGIEPAG